jgi:hypothetical protein
MPSKVAFVHLPIPAHLAVIERIGGEGVLAGGVHLAAPELLLSAAAISAVSTIPVGVYAGRSGAVTLPSAAAPLKQSLAATEGVTPDALTAYG